MKSDGSSGRQFGQRTLPPLFPIRTSSPSGEGSRTSKKRVSLSEFLDRKLGKNKSNSTNRSVQEKRCTFSSYRSPGRLSAATEGEKGESAPLDGSAILQFISRAEAEKRSITSNNDEFDVTEEPEPRSRKRNYQLVTSAGDEEEPTPAKLLLVLADDPKPGTKLKFNAKDTRIKPQFDHYASGSGLWDSDREGVNGEEVGFKEVWEGVGSATLGGLEWH
ncbi:RNA-binding protein [Wolffia australiana]